MKRLAMALALATLPATAQATSGPGCLYVVNVATWDVLNMRARPSASARIVDRLRPQAHGIIHLDDTCIPLSRPWGSRWCPVTHYDGDRVTKGWVKARYVRDSDCP
ncbi:SH3 domain-containing protein [Zhengella sp. ZM62]|uniref:SH3 domain-containing protein n=1 Tax=Zhengella sedimenti TaxID=3390035 RepID=UPI003976D3AF